MDDYKWIFSGIGIFVLSAVLTFFRTKAHYFTGIKLLDRDQTSREYGTLKKRCESATSTVFISGNDCKFVVESASESIDKLLKRDIRVKILAVDPNSQAPEMLAQIDPRFHSAEELRSSMTEVMRRFNQWKRQYPTLFDYRLLPFLPALGFFIVDPTSDKGIVKIEIYTAKPWLPIDSRPHIVLSKRNREWREYFVRQWENYWTLAKEGTP